MIEGGDLKRAAVRRWLALPLLGIAALGSGDTALAQAPAVVEPGFVVETFPNCTAHEHGSTVSAPSARSVSCTPAAWGPERLAVGVHDLTFGNNAEILLVDPPNPAVVFKIVGPLGSLTLGEIEASPPGWPPGDLLYVVERDGLTPNHVTGFSAFSEQGTREESFYTYSQTEGMGAIALDPSGDFGHDILFRFGDEVLRRTPTGRVSQFLPFPLDDMRFGPGGVWGTDLYTRTSVVSEDGSTRPWINVPVGPWAFGPGFEGDMFADCWNTTVCRIKIPGGASVFATGFDPPSPTWCGGSLWFFKRLGGACIKVSPLAVDVTADIRPTHMNSRARGSSFSITTKLVDRSTGVVVDPTLLEPAYISRIHLPYADDPAIPVPSAEPGCDSATQDGIWETPGSRRLNRDGSMEIVFEEPSDGNCETLDGNRRDLVELLQSVYEEEQVTICFVSRHPDVLGTIEACGQVTGINRGRSHLRGPVPLELPVRTRP